MGSDRPKRTQFSSCDACREARVACDAVRAGYEPGDADWSGSCSRCIDKQRPCTFTWIRKNTWIARRRQGRLSQTAPVIIWDSSDAIHANTNESLQEFTRDNPSSITVHCHGSHSSSRTRSQSPEQLFAPEPNPDPVSDLVERQVRKWCTSIFDGGFGTVFRLLVSPHGCPIAQSGCEDTNISAVDLFSGLDASMETIWDEEPSPVNPNTPSSREKHDSRSELRSQEIDDSLQHTVHAYAAPWLLNLPPGVLPVDSEYLQNFIRQSWRSARKDMPRVVNRISYRSALALYLFSQTPVPSGVSEDEELDGINGFVCLQAALQQIQQLRLKIRSSRYHSSDVPAWSTALTRPSIAPVMDFRPTFVDLESRAYWATVCWDTAASVTLEVNSTLTSGLRGACEEPAWVLARSYLIESFHLRTEEWRQSSFEITDEIASQIISAAAVGRTYLWRTVASVKEALREGVDEDRVMSAWNAFHDGVRVFKTTIEPLMTKCEKQLHFLSQENKLNWYVMVLHHHLGVLLLVHALETANRLDLLPSLHETRLEAEHTTLDVLSLGLSSKFVLKSAGGEAETELRADLPLENYAAASPSSTPSQSRVEVPFTGIDPWPDHTLASIQFAYLAIHRRYLQRTISKRVHADLSSTLLGALNQLPRSLRSVAVVRQQLLQLRGEATDDMSGDGK